MAALSQIDEILFAQMQRMASGLLKGDELLDEVRRTDGIVDLADKMLDGKKLQLDAAKLFANNGASVLPHLPQISPPKESQ